MAHGLAVHGNLVLEPVVEAPGIQDLRLSNGELVSRKVWQEGGCTSLGESHALRATAC